MRVNYLTTIDTDQSIGDVGSRNEDGIQAKGYPLESVLKRRALTLLENRLQIFVTMLSKIVSTLGCVSAKMAVNDLNIYGQIKIYALETPTPCMVYICTIRRSSKPLTSPRLLHMGFGLCFTTHLPELGIGISETQVFRRMPIWRLPRTALAREQLSRGLNGSQNRSQYD